MRRIQSQVEAMATRYPIDTLHEQILTGLNVFRCYKNGDIPGYSGVIQSETLFPGV